ncbi:MAG: dihydrofolate reductase [Bradymonadia bacterium]|jgi:dihydrofolate reductase
MSRPSTIVYIATTLDGFIARPNDAIDWLEHDTQGSDYGWEAFRASIDGFLVGRRTYEQVLGFGVPWPYSGLQTAVWSRTLTQEDVPTELADENVRVDPGTPAEVLAGLRERGATSVWLDGGGTIRAFLAAGLVDELVLTRIPILIGEGIPLLGHGAGDIPLEHVATEAFESGVVQSRYRVGR